MGNGWAQTAIHAMSVTPFDGRDRLDEPALRLHLRRLARGGVGICLGSYGTGEGHLMRPDEVRLLYEIAVDEVGDEAPLCAAAVGLSDTGRVVELAGEAAQLGVDTVQIHPPRPGPVAIRPRPDEIERFYADVLGAIGTPVVLTNQVVMVGYALPTSLLADLAREFPQVVGIATTDPSPVELVGLIDAVGDSASVHVGMLSQLLTVLALGGAGALCFEANVSPSLCRRVPDAFHDGDLERATAGFAQLMRLHRVLMQYQNPRSVKSALQLLGCDAGVPRRPYLALPEDEAKEIGAVLDTLDIPEAGDRA